MFAYKFDSIINNLRQKTITSKLWSDIVQSPTYINNGNNNNNNNNIKKSSNNNGNDNNNYIKNSNFNFSNLQPAATPQPFVCNQSKRARTTTSDMDLVHMDRPTINALNNPPTTISYRPKTNPTNILMVGKNKDISTKLNNGIPVVKRTHFYLSNGPRCTSVDIVDYYASHNIKLISCFPVLKFSPTNPSTGTNQLTQVSSSFRICVNNNDVLKFLNPDILPEDATIQYWVFKPKLSA